MPERQVLDPEEIVLTGKVLAFLEEQGTGPTREDADRLRESMELLVRLRQLVFAYPSIIRSHEIAGELRDVHTLTDAICRSNPYSIEAYLPTRAVVGRSYLVAKLNLFRLLIRLCRHHLPADNRRQELGEQLERVVRDMVTTIIAEDVLISIASDQGQKQEIRRKAIYLLADLWERRTSRSVKDFFPLLFSVWEAKARVTISYGTLSGTAELLAMMREGCDAAVIDYFTGEMIPEDERQALIELVFNTTYEELETMRRYMEGHRLQVLSPDEVARIFDVPITSLHQTTATPVEVFSTFRERQVNAYQRKSKNLPGPKKTAEEYLMIYFLEQSSIAPPSYHLDCDDRGS